MKRIGLIVAMIFCVIIVGVLLIRVSTKDTDVTKNTTKVGFLLNGAVNDYSWGQSHYEAMEKTAKKLNLTVVYKENVPETEESIPVMEALIQEGCKIIICNSFNYGDYELEVAKAHPEIYFFHATGIQENSNMATYFGRIYQMRYLSGIVAGLQTETNEIGYVAAFPIAEVNRGINAFTLGVQAVNPNATVHVEWSNTWTDEKETAAATNQLLEAYPQIDVLTLHSDAATPLEIAEQKGVWMIGYNIDNSELYPKTFLTAPIWKWENFYEPRILECLQGKFVGKHYWEGVETGVVSLGTLSSNVKPGIAEKVEQEQQRLNSNYFDVFYGPIYDNEGNIRIPEGESMSDYSMLNDFNWYVKGVQIHETK